MSDLEDKIFDKIKSDIDKDELDKNLNDRVVSIFAQKTNNLYILVSICVLILSGVLVWLVIKFYNAETVEDMIFWGLHALVALVVQAFGKLWFWLEMNRVSVLRNIKRLELQLAIRDTHED
jgi:hypothetical protein